MKQETQEFIDTLVHEFEHNRNEEIAAQKKAYMKNNFEFLGIKMPLLDVIMKPFVFKTYLPDKSQLETIVKNLWAKPEREYQMCAQKLAFRYNKVMEEKDIEYFEFMITHKSWWDSVDFIAVNLVGPYFKKYPNLIEKYIQKWIYSEDMWLRRSAIIFQLKYKDLVDTELLNRILESQLGSKEFFINKAIGWMLREYSKTNHLWVIQFVNNHQLSNLSKREALRLMKL